MEAAQVPAHDGAREANLAPAHAPTEQSWWRPADPAVEAHQRSSRSSACCGPACAQLGFAQ